MTRADELKEIITSEADLCAFFMREVGEELEGWVCHPETGGFDIVMAHVDGRQIGVEAKLQLNAKVADQILPSESSYRYLERGPDHRLVIVRSITEANAGIARMLTLLGVRVISPRLSFSSKDSKEIPKFQLRYELGRDEDVREPDKHHGFNHAYYGHSHMAMFDWNPAKRIELPEIPSTAAAGVPGPVQMTPWKMGAMRVLARLRAQGYISTKQIAAEGVSPSIWTQSWLVRGEIRGQWLEGPKMTKIDQQHPELYALALTRAKEEHAKAFALEAPG